MANTYVDYTGADGTGTDGTDFNFSFEYLRDAHVKVKVNGVETSAFTIVTSPVQLIRFNTAPAASATIKIYRDSRGDFSPLVDFVDGSILTENELDESYKHNLFIGQEASEGQGGEQLTKKGLEHYDAEGNKIINLFAPSDNTDAANKAYVDQTIDNAIALGGSPAIVSLGGYDVTALGTTTARSLADRFAETFNVMDYGAYNDGTNTAATTTAIMAAFAAAQANGSGSIVFPAGTYSITESPVLESPNSEDPTQNIGPFSISGYGATIDMGTSYTELASPINSILKSGITIAGVTNVTIMGLTFQGTGTSLSTATTNNRYNVPEPLDPITLDPLHKGSGVRIQGYQEATVKDCTFNGLKLGIVINDDDPRGTLPIPASQPIDSGIYNICNNRFFANWQALSFTYGGNHKGTISGNYIEECVTKLISQYGNSKSDNQLGSTNHVISNNVWKNCPSVIIGLNNCVFSNNVLDTVIGGILASVQSDYPNTNFNYDLVNLTVDSNVFNYTNTWSTTSESNMVPIAAIQLATDDAFTASQTSFYKNIKFTNNSVRTDAIASTSAGIIQLSTTNADSVFENLNISNNDITITSDNGVFIYNDTVSADVQFNFSTKIQNNTFRRGEGAISGGAGNFEITLANSDPVTSSTTNVLQVTGNAYFGSTATNSTFRLQRFAQCILDGNQFYVGRAGAITAAIFDTIGCPLITASSNYVTRNTTDNRGTLIGYGILDSNDQAIMESVRIQTSGNTMTRAYAGIHPVNSIALFTFASGHGLIESKNDKITDDTSINWINAVTNVDTFCVVSPTNRDLTTSFISYSDAQTVVPVGYSVKTRLGTSGDVSAFRLGSTAWLSEGTLS